MVVMVALLLRIFGLRSIQGRESLPRISLVKARRNICVVKIKNKREGAGHETVGASNSGF
jgi:hypothetical protein